jgi:hypothetical protein
MTISRKQEQVQTFAILRRWHRDISICDKCKTPKPWHRVRVRRMGKGELILRSNTWSYPGAITIVNLYGSEMG